MVQGLFEDQTDQTPAEPLRRANAMSSILPEPDGESESEPFTLSDYQPETKDETMRRSGLAWSAGIAFFSAIVFMLFLGWLADWLLGSSPWGLVGGIVLGSIIGFLQFFRITSQIFGPTSSTPSEHPLLPQAKDDE